MSASTHTEPTIEEIRTRAAADYRGKTGQWPSLQMKRDINFLLAEVDRLKAERDELGNGIAQAAIKRGIIDGSIPLTGPQLLMFCEDLGK